MTQIVNGYNLDEIKAEIRARGYRFDDKTPYGGCIWVSTGRPEAADGAFFREIERRTGAPFHYKADGPKHARPRHVAAWWFNPVNEFGSRHPR